MSMMLRECCLLVCLFAGCASSNRLIVTTGTKPMGDGPGDFYCDIPPSGWPSQDHPYIHATVVAKADCEQRLSVSVVAPPEARVTAELTLPLPRDNPASFDTPCFQKPRSGEDVILRVAVRCEGQAVAAMSKCRVPW